MSPQFSAHTHTHRQTDRQKTGEPTLGIPGYPPPDSRLNQSAVCAGKGSGAARLEDFFPPPPSFLPSPPLFSAASLTSVLRREL